MPSTPHEAELDNRPSQQYAPRPAPGFAAPQFAAPFHPGHSHHFSNNTAPWLYPPYTMAPPDGLYTGRDYHPSLFSEQNAVHGVYQGHFSSAHASASMNGRSHTPRSPARSSAKAQSEHDGEPVVVPQQNGVSSAAVDPKIDNTPFELAGYLSSQFGNPEFADFVLQIHSDGAKLLSMPVHGILVARSQAIASAIRSATPMSRSKDSRTLVDIFASNKLLTIEALNEAMKILYGAPLLSPQAFLYGMRPYHPDGEQAPSFVEARRRMAQVLSYAATGEELQLHSMAARGVEIAKALLRWDTFDQPLCLALESGVPASGTTDSYKTTLLYDVVNFLAYNFPVDFALFTIAPELAQMPRMPNIIESRHPSHNPRLSKIRFGDVPPEDELKPSHMTRILSSVLLSLPLTVLEYILNHPALANRLGWGAVVQVMQATIEERENRRTKALKQQNKPTQDGALPQPLLENLYWEERVEPSSEHTSGYKLSERRIASHV
ncbi:hypothetical protein BCR34DRAFT_212375 [Clohesyomyces aquaticus]|uniref:Uncharacterized protein n=1 Tax=Clohesyomyces aquaticus TaxID=1231657 RepID=A0A1Y1ZX69_9PLEO|nr:hypothetical protein BCR34DRAFT_212375 [Clohesyomyces aquaticus]